MTDRKVTKQRLQQFEACMLQEEKRKSTIEKYMRDVRKLQVFAGERELTKELLLQYKNSLYESGKYRVASINSFLAATNYFCTCMQWTELHVKLFRIQQDAFLPENQELSVQEYQRLIGIAMQRGEERLAMLIQTIGSTGIRISELPNITVESLQEGKTEIYNKGKTRRILFPTELIELLKCYAGRNHIRHGCIFRTYTGEPLDRCNIWRDMKHLCVYAGVAPGKVYPHNLRHLFARRFYEINQDIAKLADILGHSSIETTANNGGFYVIYAYCFVKYKKYPILLDDMDTFRIFIIHCNLPRNKLLRYANFPFSLVNQLWIQLLFVESLSRLRFC